MMMVLDALSWTFLVGGALFCIIGAVGLIRMPDFYARTHAVGITDTMGAGLILIGLLFQAGWSLVAVKLILILLFMFLTSPAAGFGVTKAAYAHGVRFSGKGTEAESTGGGDVVSD